MKKYLLILLVSFNVFAQPPLKQSVNPEDLKLVLADDTIGSFVTSILDDIKYLVHTNDVTADRYFRSASWPEIFRKIEHTHGWDRVMSVRKSLRNWLVKPGKLVELFLQHGDFVCSQILPELRADDVVSQLQITSKLMHPEFNPVVLAAHKNILVYEKEYSSLRNDDSLDLGNDRKENLKKLISLETDSIAERLKSTFKAGTSKFDMVDAVAFRQRRLSEGGDAYLRSWSRVLKGFSILAQTQCKTKAKDALEK